jgi:Uma2 family endonuclease
MITQLEKHFYTAEEYFSLEESAEYKSEYRDGEIVAMTGGTTNHNQIALNFCTKFKFAMTGQDYGLCYLHGRCSPVYASLATLYLSRRNDN